MSAIHALNNYRISVLSRGMAREEELAAKDFAASLYDPKPLGSGCINNMMRSHGKRVGPTDTRYDKQPADDKLTPLTATIIAANLLVSGDA